MSEIIELSDAAPVLIRSRAHAYWELTKPRIAGLVLVVTALGFYLALPAETERSAWALLLHTLLGTALISAGANAMNQYLEADVDGKMARTADRPLPSERLGASEVLTFSVVVSLAGCFYLTLGVNVVAGALALTALFVYVLLYTPLKRKTRHSVLVGAVAGALPPAIGWAAAGSLSAATLWLVGILFFWQLPHFAAIAWLYREDYRRAGLDLTPVADPTGQRTGVCIVMLTAALLTVSLLPALHGLTGSAYAFGAAALGLAFLGFGGWFVIRETKEAARLHILASVVYLPLLLALMVIDKTPMQ